MREIIANYIKYNRHEVINDITIEKWIEYESGGEMNTEQYIKGLLKKEQGGQTEIKLCAHIFSVNIDVYKRLDENSNKFELHADFGCNKFGASTLNIVYKQEEKCDHYDYLQLNQM